MKQTTTPRTYSEAIIHGYEPTGTTYQRGYISRRCNINDQPVCIAGGSRSGELYVLIPAYNTTQYCMRQYLSRRIER